MNTVYVLVQLAFATLSLAVLVACEGRILAEELLGDDVAGGTVEVRSYSDITANQKTVLSRVRRSDSCCFGDIFCFTCPSRYNKRFLRRTRSGEKHNLAPFWFQRFPQGGLLARLMEAQYQNKR